MGIINVKITSLTIRKTIQVEASATLNEALDKAGVSASGDVSMSLGGYPVSANDLNKKFNDFPNVDLDKEVVLAAIVNSKNA